MGLVRASHEHLSVSRNRDGKATLNPEDRRAIQWLFENAPLPPNVLLQLDPQVVVSIMQLSSGQKRINQLFRVATCRRVGRAVVATVAQQDDYMKRLRANGGAREKLRSEGILILGQYSAHARIAEALGIPVPGPGESVSVRVIQAEAGVPGAAEIEGAFWRIAGPEDPPVIAPRLPDIRKARGVGIQE